MPVSFPLQFSQSQWPARKGVCGVCEQPLTNSVVYLSAGTCADVEKSHLVDAEAFWSCGIHSADDHESREIVVAQLPNQEQFDLSFCSTNCLKHFLLAIVDSLEQK